MKTLVLTLAALTLASCTQLNSLEITAEDNAMACIKGNTSATSGVFGGNISGITVELPAGAVLGANVSGITVELPAQVDTSGWTAEDWKTLAELCD